MARKREIKPSFYADEDLAECSIWARHLFPALWQLADRDGRLEDRPAFIRIHAFPYDNLEALGLSVNDMLAELAGPRKRCPDGGGFIVRYVVDGRAYIQIRNFSKHQRPHPKETDSQIPEAPLVTPVREKVDPSREKVNPITYKPGLQSLSSLSSHSLATDPVAVAPAPWNREAAELWQQEYKGAPPKQFFAALKPLVKLHGWERVRPALVTYLAETPVEYVNLVKAFVGAFGTWELKAQGVSRAPPGKSTTGDRTVEAMRQFAMEESGDNEIGVLGGLRQIGSGCSADVGRPDLDRLPRSAGGGGRP